MKERQEPIPVAIYARVFRQNVDLPIDAQLNVLRNYSRENDYVVVREYVDDDERVHIVQTLQFGKMIEEARLPQGHFPTRFWSGSSPDLPAGLSTTWLTGRSSDVEVSASSQSLRTSTTHPPAGS